MFRCSFPALIATLYTISSDFSVNSQGILSDLPPPCEFYGTLSASIKTPWSTDCTSLVGDIVIDSTSNMTATQLQKLFQNVSSIEGSLIIRNTALKQLSFLKNVKVLTKGWFENVLEIVENPHLTQINLEKLNRSNGVIMIQDNPNLDLAMHCHLFDKVLLDNRVILRNKVNCGE
ncbi:receptor L domain protein [Ancylostoma caninum]|uniref:Receptor L domain protein n=1 Tax=Ancylostoma caninum TaxID=29170 RepID=A0A368GS22_ANCCA|nr:receptor L domain protein [Ancylostoma caninum]